MWSGLKTLVTGGASFIGSHLVDALVARGAIVRVADNLSSGTTANLGDHLEKGRVELMIGDLKDLSFARHAAKHMQVVFHLAADHGGRGYVDRYQAECATNFALDGIVFMAAREASAQKIVFASSGCVYPNHLQTDPAQELYLHEDLVQPPYDADNTYGWAKLMGELTLKAYYDQFGMPSVSCRYFTVYGPRAKENHAVIAMIARTFIQENPFVVWGTGEQIRNWTYVDDIVEGTILAAEKIGDATPINLGTMERIRVADAARDLLRRADHHAELEFHPEMPTGPYNRVADNSRARRLLGWAPKVKFTEGLQRTIDWYFTTHDREQIKKTLAGALIEKKVGERV